MSKWRSGNQAQSKSDELSAEMTIHLRSLQKVMLDIVDERIERVRQELAESEAAIGAGVAFEFDDM